MGANSLMARVRMLVNVMVCKHTSVTALVVQCGQKVCFTFKVASLSSLIGSAN